MGARSNGNAFFIKETIDRRYGLDDISEEAKVLFGKHCRGGVDQIAGLFEDITEQGAIELYFLLIHELHAVMRTARDRMKANAEKQLGHPL